MNFLNKMKFAVNLFKGGDRRISKLEDRSERQVQNIFWKIISRIIFISNNKNKNALEPWYLIKNFKNYGFKFLVALVSKHLSKQIILVMRFTSQNHTS